MACVATDAAKRLVSERSWVTVTCDLAAAAGQRQHLAGQVLDARRHQTAAPTSMPRKRAGAVPWETCIIWPGSPLPQFSRP